ncbi:glycosyltransferase [Halomonas sp. WWR20]
MPKFAVLLAAHNGEKWIAEQVRTILGQKNVSVTIFISIDVSEDNTYSVCQSLAKEFRNQISILPVGDRFGGAGPNFYRLIKDVNFHGFDYIAFSDQDDLWFEDKLWCAHEKMSANGAHAYSSNVIAYWSSGRQLVINKAQPQKKWDYLFEAAGPGSTYVLKKYNAEKLKDFVAEHWSEVNEFSLHDWLIYAFFRVNGWCWFIDSCPSLYYRQHESNQIGANDGIKQAFKRLSKVKQGWYRNEIRKLALLLKTDRLPPGSIVCYGNYFNTLRLISSAKDLRRRVRDQIMLSVFILFGFF